MTQGGKRSQESDWSVFEKLSVRIVSQAFRLQPTAVIVTQKSKDGGYDGQVIHQHGINQGLLGDIEDLTLVEAKLRNSAAGIGLRDFAATLVIAHNECANTLVVVANKPFTPQALEETSRFFRRTNLRVKLVDGPTVSGWVRKNFDDLVGEFGASFLQRLILKDHNAEKAERKVHVCSSRTQLFQDVRSRPARTLTVETGWREDGTIADCDLEFEDDGASLVDQALPPLIGQSRKDLLKELVTNLGNSSGSNAIHLLTGTGGVGKSVIVSHLLARLGEVSRDREKCWVGVIDVGREASSRALFVSILTAVLGVNPRDLTAGDGHWRPETFIAQLGGGSANDLTCKAVARALLADWREYESGWDLNVEPLLDFLRLLVQRRTRRQPLVLVFHELNKGTEETLDFLCQASRVIAGAGASILLELRDRGYEKTATTRERGGPATVMSLEHWDAVVAKFNGLCNGGRFDLAHPSPDEAVEYVQSLLPGLGKQQARVIVDHVGTVPLHLKLTADWHMAEGVLAREDGGIFLVEDLEKFFADQNITPRSVNLIFDRLIEAWGARADRIHGRAIIAATLLRGELSVATLGVLDESVDAEHLAHQLVASGLFRLSRESAATIEAAHDLLLERMEYCLSDKPIGVSVVATQLFNHIERVCPDPEKRPLREADLLLAMGPAYEREAARSAHMAASGLALTRDWTEAARYFGRAHDALKKLSERQPDDDQLRVSKLGNLADWLDVEVLRYRIGTAENRNRVSAFLNELRFGPDLPLTLQERELLSLRAAVIEWRHYYVQEDFDEALRVAIEGRDLALSCSADVDKEIRGMALANHAVSLKFKERRKDSVAAFDAALNALPQSYTVVAERLSNIGAINLRNDPAKALECYREILDITRNTAYSFSEIIHTHTDVAMADFLMGDLPSTIRDAQRAIKLAMDNSVHAEEARGRNILGCAYWVTGNVKAAHQEFTWAAFASERSISYRFLWRMRTNAAGTALALGKLDEAYGFARSAENAIVSPRESEFPGMMDDDTYLTSRWYVALIAIAKCYAGLGRTQELERLYRRIALPLFKEHADGFICGNPPPVVFAKTTHLHNGIIMITG